ncbi:unnamed protein product [Pseudo-nitzschia multistriata]|uniref:Uncharacterized protein n=1 Tax=Pseudo-nitzschia multistriata TaxID=183589 RepID=A0A448ZNR4_9STRA|nr:unnamed protein product [Pseudo-nitzschia multistriata]
MPARWYGRLGGTDSHQKWRRREWVWSWTSFVTNIFESIRTWYTWLDAFLCYEIYCISPLVAYRRGEFQNWASRQGNLNAK